MNPDADLRAALELAKSQRDEASARLAMVHVAVESALGATGADAQAFLMAVREHERKQLAAEVDELRGLVASAREVGCERPLPTSYFSNTRALKAEVSLLALQKEAIGLREHVATLETQVAELNTEMAKAGEHINQLETEQAHLVVREMYSVAFVSRDLVERAFEVLTGGPSTGPELAQAAVLLKEALGR